MAVALAWLGGLGALTRTGLAQNLPDAVVTTAMTPANKKTVEEFIGAQKADLSGADVAKINRARRVLCEPCFNPNSSESFRREYSLQLIPVLSPLITQAGDEVAINAGRIAGALGTDQGVALLLTAMKDKRAGVRVMAAKSFGLGLRMSATTSPPLITARQAKDDLSKFGAIIAAEKDPHVLDAIIGALDDCAGLGRDNFEDMPDAAIALLQSTASRLARDRAAPGAFDLALRHAAQAMVRIGQKQTEAAAKESAGVAGEIVAGIVARVDAGGLTDAERSRLALIAGLCERAIQLAVQTHGKTPVEYHLEQLLLEGKDAEFKEAAKRMFNDLTGPTFQHPPARFK